MKLFKNIVSFVVVVLFVTRISAQENADNLVHEVAGKLNKIKDYSVEANIKVDMPFIRMLPINVKIYFKQKNKFKVESKSIAIVPRQGFDQISTMLADNHSYTPVIQGEEMIDSKRTVVVNIIPLSDTSDLILGKLWVDPTENVILKSQLTTKSNGTIATEYSYSSQTAYGLPDKMIFTVDVRKFKLPKNIPGEAPKNDADKNTNNNKKGKIYITLSNYQVNKGIADELFKK